MSVPQKRALSFVLCAWTTAHALLTAPAYCLLPTAYCLLPTDATASGTPVFQVSTQPLSSPGR